MVNIENYLKPGLHNSHKHIVKKEELASFLKTGNVEVIATPSLIILMEQVICKTIHEKIPPEYTSVSAEINIKHILPVQEGEEVICSIHLKFVEEGKLFFDFAIFNATKDIIAIGAHERFVIKNSNYKSN